MYFLVCLVFLEVYALGGGPAGGKVALPKNVASWTWGLCSVQVLEFSCRGLQVLSGRGWGSASTVSIPFLEVVVGALEVWLVIVEAGLDGCSSLLGPAFPICLEAGVDSPGEASRLCSIVVGVFP